MSVPSLSPSQNCDKEKGWWVEAADQRSALDYLFLSNPPSDVPSNITSD